MSTGLWRCGDATLTTGAIHRNVQRLYRRSVKATWRLEVSGGEWWNGNDDIEKTKRKSILFVCLRCDVSLSFNFLFWSLKKKAPRNKINVVLLLSSSRILKKETLQRKKERVVILYMKQLLRHASQWVRV